MEGTMKELQGKHTNAKIFSDGVEQYALAQIQMLIDHPAFAGSKVRVMPDVHPGTIGPIGFTATVGGSVLPGVVGIDLGCGMTMAVLKQTKVEFPKLDTVIREGVPAGYRVRRIPHRFVGSFDFSRLLCFRHIHREKAENSLGTLGGGNHFIELDRSSSGELCVVIHSGSRHLGKEVSEYYLTEGQKYWKDKGEAVPYELTPLEGGLMDAYVHDVSIVQEYAALNREAILDELCRGMKWKVQETRSCIHNYLDTGGEGMILRKGAISAKVGEKLIIPINMRDGVILGTGKGNPDWNASAPHGAGRIMSRTEVKQNFTVSAFKKEMQGIYSTSIGADTLDEAPFAYRGLEEIRAAVGDTLTIEDVLKPIYNFKAGGAE